ncbi:MAG TPA: cation-translocating P-type ATPase [Dehalococcoidia bacterium]|nr:cation-translocating P-type ATPase [Dehalococcoidia bacterium]
MSKLAQAHKTFIVPVLVIRGDCRRCLRRLEESVSALRGVASARLQADGRNLAVTYDPALVSMEAVKVRAHESGVALTKKFGHVSLDISGMDCADCSVTLEKAVARLPGVVDVSVSFPSASLVAEFESDQASPQDIVSQVEGMGYGAVSAGRREEEKPHFWQRQPRSILTGASGLFLVAGYLSGFFLPGDSPTHITLFAIALLLGGFPSFRAAFYSLRRTLNFDMNVLMTVAIIGAVAIGAWEEAAAVAFLFSLGNTLESLTLERTRGAIRTLVGLSPKEATVLRSGSSFPLPVEEVKVGDTILVKPGEKVPLDGEVLEGASSVNQAPITGESAPVEKGRGDQVFAGSINQKGSLTVRISHAYQDTTLAKVIHLVEEAQAQRAPSQRLVDRFSRYYTPSVIALSGLVAMVPPIVLSQPFGPWVYRALALLLTACPCALVISTPVSIVSAIGAAARRGILIKGGAHLEEAGSLRAIAFDKTGTLTLGRLEVTDILPFNGQTPDEVLGLAAGVEAHSEHPLAQAVMRKARHQGVALPPVRDFESLPGLGARARVNGQTLMLGSLRLFEERGLELPASARDAVASFFKDGKTAVLVGSQDGLIGVLALADTVRASAHHAVEGLRRQGVKELLMLSGDNYATAAAIARSLGMSYRAELLPQEKVQEVKSLRAQYGSVAMVGDGVNDAPAMSASSLGIAMGAAGVDVALETADVALMSDDLEQLPYLVALGRRTRSTIFQNVGFSLLVKAAIISLVFPGWLTLWLAVAGDMGSALLVTLNGMRLLAGNDRRSHSPNPDGKGHNEEVEHHNCVNCTS